MKSRKDKLYRSYEYKAIVRFRRAQDYYSKMMGKAIALAFGSGFLVARSQQYILSSAVSNPNSWTA